MDCVGVVSEVLAADGNVFESPVPGPVPGSAKQVYASLAVESELGGSVVLVQLKTSLLLVLASAASTTDRVADESSELPPELSNTGFVVSGHRLQLNFMPR